MRKRKSSYLKPYVRRLKKTDRSDSLRNSIRLALAEELGFKYVMIQRGSNSVMAVGESKQGLKRSLLVIEKNKDFSKWANLIKKRCQGVS